MKLEIIVRIPFTVTQFLEVMLCYLSASCQAFYEHLTWLSEVTGLQRFFFFFKSGSVPFQLKSHRADLYSVIIDKTPYTL